MGRPRACAEPVRSPTALPLPGDGPAASSAAGMAPDDYVDREFDARERPERPLPSGRVRPWEALGALVDAGHRGPAPVEPPGPRLTTEPRTDQRTRPSAKRWRGTAQ